MVIQRAWRAGRATDVAFCVGTSGGGAEVAGPRRERFKHRREGTGRQTTRRPFTLTAAAATAGRRRSAWEAERALRVQVRAAEMARTMAVQLAELRKGGSFRRNYGAGGQGEGDWEREYVDGCVEAFVYVGRRLGLLTTRRFPYDWISQRLLPAVCYSYPLLQGNPADRQLSECRQEEVSDALTHAVLWRADSWVLVARVCDPAGFFSAGEDAGQRLRGLSGYPLARMMQEELETPHMARVVRGAAEAAARRRRELPVAVLRRMQAAEVAELAEHGAAAAAATAAEAARQCIADKRAEFKAGRRFDRDVRKGWYSGDPELYAALVGRGKPGFGMPFPRSAGAAGGDSPARGSPPLPAHPVPPDPPGSAVAPPRASSSSTSALAATTSPSSGSTSALAATTSPSSLPPPPGWAAVEGSIDVPVTPSAATALPRPTSSSIMSAVHTRVSARAELSQLAQTSGCARPGGRCCWQEESGRDGPFSAPHVVGVPGMDDLW